MRLAFIALYGFFVLTYALQLGWDIYEGVPLNDGTHDIGDTLISLLFATLVAMIMFEED